MTQKMGDGQTNRRKAERTKEKQRKKEIEEEEKWKEIIDLGWLMGTDKFEYCPYIRALSLHKEKIP